MFKTLLSILLVLVASTSIASESFVTMESDEFQPEIHALVVRGVTEDLMHFKAHMGERYSVVTHETVTGSGSFYVLINTPATVNTHFTWVVESDGPAFATLYRATTPTGGVNYTVFNRNDHSSNSSSMVIASNPTGTSLGATKMSSHSISTGKSQGGELTGDEWILRLGSKYLIEIINRQNQPIEVDLEFRWAEFN